MAASDRVSINEALPLLQVHGLIEWDELGLHLGLSDAAIKEISSMVGEVNLKRRVMISKWLQSDLKATWSKLAKALLMMNPPYKVLAAKIRQQHYPGTEAATSLRDDQETDEEPSAETSRAMIQVNEDKIKRSFSSLLINVGKVLKSKSSDVTELRQFLVTFFKNDECIPKSPDIDEILSGVTISGLWSHHNYSPLERLTEHFLLDDTNVEKLFSDYKACLSGFYFATKIIHYIKYSQMEDDDVESDAEPRKVPLMDYVQQNYKKIKVVLKLSRKISDLSLSYVENLWRSFASEFDLPSLTAVLKKIVSGSLEITWYIPPHEAELIRPTSRFCRQHDIILISIDDHIIYGEKQMVQYETRFLELCCEGSASVRAFIELLRLGVDPNIHDEDGCHPLWHASYDGRTELVTLFMDYGAAVDLQTEDELGETALHAANGRGNFNVMIVLVQRGADVNSLTKTGDTPLKYASDEGYVEAVHLLLDSGADIDKGEQSPLWAASSEGRVDVIEALLDRGAKVNLPNDDEIGETALHAASKKGDVNVMTILVQRGADVDSLTKTGVTPLAYASKWGTVETVHLLLDSGADIDKGEQSPLWAASYMGRVDVIETLLDRGAKVNLPTNDEFSESALNTACGHGHVDVASLLLTKGADINYKTKTGWTSLLRATLEGYSNVVKLLIQHQVQLEIENNEGRTALLVACWEGHYDIACQLLQAGANPNAQDQERLTALILATQKGHSDIITALMDANADPNMTEHTYGWSAIFFAAKEGNVKIVQELISRKASVELKDKTGVTAYDIAKESGHQAVCDELERHINQETQTEITKDQQEQVQKSSNRFMRIFDYLEKSLLRGRAEKMRKQQELMKGTSSNILESRQHQEEKGRKRKFQLK